MRIRIIGNNINIYDDKEHDITQDLRLMSIQITKDLTQTSVQLTCANPYLDITLEQNKNTIFNLQK
jgi:hypothetical protein